MGNIRAAIALYDGVTSPLQSMHKAMGVVLNTFESMQQASGRAVDTAAIREAREEWAKAGTAFDAIEENIRNANNEQQKFNNSIRGGNNSANGLLSTIKKIAVAAGGIVGINKVQNISDKLASTKARLNLLVDDGGSVDVLEQKIMASAQRSRSAYFDTASAVAKLGLNAGNAFGGNMDQVIAFMEQVNKQFVIGGATAQEQSNAMIQLTQAMAAGALRGEELNSILDGAPGIARAIEKYMGIAEGSIKTVAQEGKVTAEVVKNAMFAMADETNAKFDSMPKTWAQIWAGMKNKALSMFAPILTKINQIANSTKFQQVTTALINGLAGVANVASSALDILIAVASVFVDNWGIIQPLVLGIAAAMLFVLPKRYRKTGATVVAALLISLVICNGIMKNLYQRVRPFHADTTFENLYRVFDRIYDWSFPSGHTSASFAAAVAIRLWNKKEGIGALVLAALISFSRLYLTVHYPTDVLASVVFGSAYGGAAYLLMKKVLEKPGRLRKVLVEGASYKTLWKK